MLKVLSCSPASDPAARRRTTDGNERMRPGDGASLRAGDMRFAAEDGATAVTGVSAFVCIIVGDVGGALRDDASAGVGSVSRVERRFLVKRRIANLSSLMRENLRAR